MKKTLLILFIFISKVQCQEIIVSAEKGFPFVSTLFSINLGNCEISNIVYPATSLGDIALTPNGNLYGSSNNWCRIDRNTGSFTAIPPSSPPTSSNALVALDNNTLLFMWGTYLCSYTISNGSMVNLGNVGHGSLGDLAWYDNALYLIEDHITWGGDDGSIQITSILLIKIVLNATNTAIQSVTQINDLATTLPTIYGLASIPVSNSINMLVGGGSNKLYKICPYDASYEMICEIPNDYVISGMTSPRLAAQVPEPTNCDNLSLTDFNGPQPYLFPNPIAKDGILQIKPDNFNSPISVLITNMEGRIVFNGVKNIDHLYLDLKDYMISTGIYIVKITNGNNTYIQKLIVE